ncbi:pentapeptide repeat-containing protein [Halomonas sp. Mc5H-6]|uniref:pentapeptide repeat-containing protein n=1 Tax=Halomonas sp. Mc5H-6 TaxID=2954500 RepID=UPI0020985E75|nr:pentapeptide repeat-containing protein [Halomonas sp. Mc5H-6]MCO7244680.1 pentapeptide repeat-containing protein [Halomonas sp. Mc5H-6]
MNDREQQKVTRINELSTLARTSWIALLAYLGYIGITLLAVQDADFFVPSRQTELPLVGISIPTFWFFVFAPPLAAALYVYLHIHLLKLFDELASAPARIDGEALGDRIHPWLANNFFLTMRSDGSANERPLSRLSNLATLVLVWVTAPLVLTGFWWRSMPAHDEWLTLLLSLSLIISTYVGLTSWWSARTAACRTFRRPWANPWSGWMRVGFGSLALVVVITLSWLRTEGGIDHYANRAIDLVEAALGKDFFEGGFYPNGDWKSEQVVQEEWVASREWIPNLGTFTLGSEHWLAGRWLNQQEAWDPIAHTDLSGVELVVLPASWRPSHTAQEAFREEWCRREGLRMAVCGHMPSVHSPLPVTLSAERKNWCAQFLSLQVDVCLNQFEILNQRFESDWEEERRAMLAKLPKLELDGRDLRSVNASRVSLVNANLASTRLEGADLTLARLEGANLMSASLDRTNLKEASLERANLNEASLERASLERARLEGAKLVGARMEETGLREANLEGANLSAAQLEGADLRSSKLERAYLTFALLEGAYLTFAQLNEANLVGAKLVGADLHGARLESADLEGANLERADLTFANLEMADIKGANFEGAELRWTVMRDADLRNARHLTQAQLNGVIGNANTLLPNLPAPDTGEPYHVWSCWEKEPPDFNRLVLITNETVYWGDEFTGLTSRLREELRCTNGPRKRVGTPLAPNVPYPESYPLANVD